MKQEFFLRYLTAKKTVDDRALNAHVWGKMAELVRKRPLHILEIGAGIGTMVDRLAGADLLTHAHYTAIDNDPAHINLAQKRLAKVPNVNQISFEAVDVLEFVQKEQNRGAWDLLLAHAFLDLIDIERVLPDILALLRPGGHFYFTINFDGGTIFEPTIEPTFDALVESVYHRTMDERVVNGRPSGDSKSGRHLFHHIRNAGGVVTAAGSSDWVIFPHAEGYPADEAFFLQTILGYVESALTPRPEIDQTQLQEWLQTRRQQLKDGDLVFIAHQLDLFGHVPD